MKRNFFGLLVGLSLVGALGLHGAVPNTMFYQGRVQSNGADFDGGGEFKFALVNDDGTVTYWSNDDTSNAGSEPTASVTLKVQQGLFMVALGDTSYVNMLPIPVSVFSNPDVKLRLWFNDTENGWAQFSPDQPIHSVGYAMMAANVPDGIITGDKLAPDSIDATHLGDQIITETELADGSVTTPKLADDAVTSAKLAPNSVESSHVVDNSLTSADIANTLTLEQLNLGGISWDGGMRLYAKPSGGGGGIVNPSGSIRGFLVGDQYGSQFGLHLSNGSTGAVLTSRSPGGRLQLFDAFGPTTVLGSLNGGGDLSLYQMNGHPGVKLNGDRSTFSNQSSSGGEISVHTAGGQEGLLLDGNHNNAGRIEVLQPDGNPYVDILGRGSNGGGEIRVSDDSARTTIKLDGDGGEASLDSDGLLQLGRTPAANLVLDSNEITARNAGQAAPLLLNPNQGNVLVGRTTELSPPARLAVESDETQDALRVRVGTSTKLYVAGNGGVAINTTEPAAGYQLSVNGKVICEELVVQNSGQWPDYVFADDYELMALEAVEASIKQNKHLPGILSADEVQEAGIPIGTMQKQMMEKIEELTLYLLQQNKRLKEQEERITALHAQLGVHL